MVISLLCAGHEPLLMVLEILNDFTNNILLIIERIYLHTQIHTYVHRQVHLCAQKQC